MKSALVIFLQTDVQTINNVIFEINEFRAAPDDLSR